MNDETDGQIDPELAETTSHSTLNWQAIAAVYADQPEVRVGALDELVTRSVVRQYIRSRTTGLDEEQHVAHDASRLGASGTTAAVPTQSILRFHVLHSPLRRWIRGYNCSTFLQGPHFLSACHGCRFLRHGTQQ